MSYRAIYTYAWDVAEVGVPEYVAQVRSLGLNTATFAGSYHAGKFLRPKGTSGKVVFPEDGTAYFRTDPSRYGAIKPVENHLLKDRDVLNELCNSGIAVNAWMVLLHNTHLGMKHPEATAETAFGDRLLFSLCPSAPEARAYATGLCKDITESYPVTGVSLETPGFLPFSHGYHHEFGLMRQNNWLNQNMGLCFCEHCMSGAKAKGIDADALRAKTVRDVEAYLASDIDFTDDLAEQYWLNDMQDELLRSYLRFRADTVTSLVAEIRDTVRRDAAVAVIPSIAPPASSGWFEGADLPALAKIADWIEAGFYQPGVMRIRSEAFDVARRIGGTTKLRCILRPAWPDLASKAEVVEAVAAVRDAGITDFAFYNYGHIRQASLGWIAEALAQLGD